MDYLEAEAAFVEYGLMRMTKQAIAAADWATKEKKKAERAANSRKYNIVRRSASGLIQSPCLAVVLGDSPEGAVRNYAKQIGRPYNDLDVVAMAR